MTRRTKRFTVLCFFFLLFLVRTLHLNHAKGVVDVLVVVLVVVGGVIVLAFLLLFLLLLIHRGRDRGRRRSDFFLQQSSESVFVLADVHFSQSSLPFSSFFLFYFFLLPGPSG